MDHLFNISRRMAMAAIAAGLVANAVSATGATASERFITVASTTSTEGSGLFKHLLPIFEKKTGIAVRVVAVGTGQAIKLAENGDADVLFVHHKASEDKFVADGFGVKRFDVMYNDFILVGPTADPAKIGGGKDVVAGLQAIAKAKAAFASRGDDSGTHKAELALWKSAGIDPRATGEGWYRETGSGMGPTLNTAVEMGAYVLTDRGSWGSFNNKAEHAVSVEGDVRLFNQYGVILVSPAKHKHVKAKDGQAFVDWVISPEGQKAIADFKIGGQQLFFPNAVKAAS